MHIDFDDSNFVAKASIAIDTNSLFVYDDAGNEYKEFLGRYEELSSKSSKRVLNSALEKGAEELITACPLCLYNLQKNTNGLQITYFTELLAEALGVKE